MSMVLLVVVVADRANHPEYLPKRQAVLSVMRVAAAYSPVFRAHASFMMKVSGARVGGYGGDSFCCQGGRIGGSLTPAHGPACSAAGGGTQNRSACSI
jgi:hypothetical protein